MRLSQGLFFLLAAALLVWQPQTHAQDAGENGDASKLVYTVDGKPIAFKSALGFRNDGDDALFLELSTHPIVCSDIKGAFKSLQRDEERITVRVAPVLQKDGSDIWKVSVSKYMSDLVWFGPVEALDLKAGGDVLYKFDLKIPGTNADNPPTTMQGDVVIHNCGDLSLNADPIWNFVPDLSVKLADKDVYISGATIKKDHDAYRVRLTTAMHGCSLSSIMSDFDIHFTLSPELEVSYISVKGDRLPRELRNSFGKGAKVKVDMSALTKDESIPLEVDIEADMSGYPLIIKGLVNANNCPE